MQIQIVSMMAAVVGDRDSIIWSGDVDPADMGAHSDSDLLAERPEWLNDQIFRFFNRVDTSDTDRLKQYGYELPSLSVGDLFHYNRTTWRVDDMGFSKLTGNTQLVVKNLLP